jgi:hypothetical protein
MRVALTLAAIGVAACGALAAPVGIASADPSAITTIGELEAQGYTVNIDRVGSGPLSECVVTSVRNPQTVTQWLPAVGVGARGNRDNTILVPVVTSRSISVSLNCTG